MATNFFKTNIRKILTAVLTLALILNLSALAVSAAPNKGNNKGEGHYTVHVHLSEAVASNKDSVTITLPNGVSYTGNMQGKTLDFTFPTTDNGFSVPAGGLFVTFVTEDGQTGTMVILNQEGNAKPNIEDEHDQGANNYRADVTVDMPEEETTEEETTEEETAHSSLPVKFFVLDPNRTVPLDGADQGINSYYPSGSYSYWNGHYVYEANITGDLADYMLRALANSDGDGKLDIGDQLLVNGNLGIIMPTDWKGLWSEFGLTPGSASITAYVIKVQNPNDFSGSNGDYYGYDDRNQKADIHVDCYVSDLGVEVTYHPNFSGAKGSHRVDEITGNSHDVLSYGETDLPENEGYEFKGWATSERGSVSYLSGGSFRVVGNTDLYAVWEKIVEVTTEEETTEEETTEEETTEAETTEEVTTEEETTEEETTEEETTEEETTEEETTEEETTEEETTEEETTEEETTEEETTEEVTTEEETTEEETTEEVTTEEETTEEETTEEETTEEETTVPYWPPVETDPVVPVYPPYNPPVSETPDDVEEIDDEDVPLDSTPEEVDDSVEVSVEESDEEFEEIEDDDVPLSDVPQTGSASFIFLAMAVASAIGLIGVNASKQEKKNR